MLKIKVTYFLTAAGLQHFPQWYDEVAHLTQKQAVYVDIRFEQHNNTRIIHLDFESQEKLSQWANTDAHARLVAEIEPYFTQPQAVEKIELADLS